MTDTKRILVVEDDLFLSMVMIKMIQQLGHQTLVVAHTEDQAVDIALENHPDLIIMDVSLKDGNGVSAMMKIHEHYDVPVIFVTGDTEMIFQYNNQVKVLNTPRLEKPVMMGDLRQVFTSVFN